MWFSVLLISANVFGWSQVRKFAAPFAKDSGLPLNDRSALAWSVIALTCVHIFEVSFLVLLKKIEDFFRLLWREFLLVQTFTKLTFKLFPRCWGGQFSFPSRRKLYVYIPYK